MFEKLKQKIVTGIKERMFGVSIGGGALDLQGEAPREPTNTDYLASFNKSNLIRSALGKIIDQVATMDLELFVAKNGRAEKVDQHELLDLLNYPNPVMSGGDLRGILVMYQKLMGDAYLYKARGNDGSVIELWPMRSDAVTIKTNDDGTIKGYYIRDAKGTETKFEPQDVIHFKSPNPLSSYYGTGMMEGLMDIVRSDMFAKKWNTAFFYNSARPDYILTADEKISDGDRKEIRNIWQKKYGGYRNAHKVAVLSNGLKPTQVSSNHKDLDFNELRKASRDDVLMTLGVPKSVMAVSDDVNRSNAETGIYVFLSLTIEPIYRAWANTFNMQLVKEADERLFLWYKDPTPADEAALDTHYEKAINNWLTINEIRDEIGLEPLEGGDELKSQSTSINIAGDNDNGDSKALSIKSTKITTKQQRRLKWAYKKILENNPMLRLEREIIDEATSEVKKEEKKGFTTQQKELIWKLFDVTLQRNEQRWYIMQEKLFIEQGIRISKQVKNTKEANPVFKIDWEAENEEFTKTALPVIISIVNETGEQAMAQVGAFGFDPTDKVASAWMQKKAITFATEVNKTTKNRLKKSLREGLDAGEGISALAKRVKDVMGDRIKSSADTIARTEVLSSSNAGTDFGYKQSGVVKGKEWLSTIDGRVRDSHAGADGQVVSMGEKFNVGSSELSFPGDPAGSPGEIINCRCTTLPVLSE